MSWRTRRIGTEEIAFEVPRQSLPSKERPRFDPRSGRAYTTKRTRDAEAAIREAWATQARGDWAGHAGEVRVAIAIDRPLPESAPKRQEGSADLMAPDVDNVSKAVLDALNGLAFKDDRQVTRLLVARGPRTPHRETATIRVRVDYYEQDYRKDRK